MLRLASAIPIAVVVTWIVEPSSSSLGMRAASFAGLPALSNHDSPPDRGIGSGRLHFADDARTLAGDADDLPVGELRYATRHNTQLQLGRPRARICVGIRRVKDAAGRFAGELRLHMSAARPSCS